MFVLLSVAHTVCVVVVSGSYVFVLLSVDHMLFVLLSVAHMLFVLFQPYVYEPPQCFLQKVNLV